MTLTGLSEVFRPEYERTASAGDTWRVWRGLQGADLGRPRPAGGPRELREGGITVLLGTRPKNSERRELQHSLIFSESSVFQNKNIGLAWVG